MKNAALKKETHQAIDNTSDTEILAAVYTILKKSMVEDEVPASLSEKQVELLDKRWDDYKKGKFKTYTIEQASELIDKRLKTIRR